MTHSSLIKLGITGTIGSGKSLVGDALEELGVPVIDTDHIVSDLYAHDETLKRTFRDHFGTTIFDEQGHICKAKLSPYVFNHPEHRHQINEWVHPRVRQKVDRFFEAPADDFPDAPLASIIRAVLVPLLFESDTRERYDVVWTVMADEATLLQRLMAREHIDELTARHKLSTQWPQAQKASAADTVIDNSGTPAETHRLVKSALESLIPQQTHSASSGSL